MKWYKCLCGATKVLRGRMPPLCEVCSICGTTLSHPDEKRQEPRKHLYFNGICQLCLKPKPIINKVTAKEIKCSLFYYYRFKRQCLCASEMHVPFGLADILVQNKKGYITEVEVKVNSSDFNNEIIRKKNKHDLYKNLSSKYIKQIPNYFYFCTPTALVKKALKTIEKLNLSYGIIEYTSQHVRWTDRLIIKKRAKLLNNNINDIIFEMMKRLNNEVCTCYSLLNELENKEKPNE